MTRRLLVVIVVFALAVAVVRNAAVERWFSTSPASAAGVWSGHPEVERSLAMSGIGQAAAAGRPPGQRVMSMFDDLAIKEPLAIEPLLARAVAAQSAGDVARAERLFRLAEARQGRSLPPHFFLADLYLRTGRAADGLREVANFTRLSPNGVSSGAPYIAQYARNRANWPEMRSIFRSQPELAGPVLSALAQDSTNAPAILALADPAHRNADSPWLRPLLGAMIGAGQYREARSLWAGIANGGRIPSELLHDPQFTDNRSPPPFNWELTQSPVGLAERGRGAGLHVIFYGSQGGPLVRQLLILPPGNYRFRVRVVGAIADPRALSWAVRCDPASSPLAALPLRAPAVLAVTFAVPVGCAAQWLELDGRAQDISGRSDIVISDLALTGGGASG